MQGFVCVGHHKVGKRVSSRPGCTSAMYSSEQHIMGFGWEEGSCYTALTVMLLFVASLAPRAPQRVSAAWRMLAAATLQVQRLQARDLCTAVQPQQTALQHHHSLLGLAALAQNWGAGWRPTCGSLWLLG